MSKDRLWTPQFMTMGGGNFFYFLSQYLLVAAMPLYILEELHGNERDAGLAMTYFQLGTVLCRPFAGKIIDSLNKHRLLVAGSCAFLLIMTAFFFLRTLPAVFGLRFLHGAIFGVTSTAAAAVAALVLPLSRKGEGIGYFALSTNLAMVVGPLVGLLLMQYWGPSAVFFFLILGALFTLIAMICNALPSSVTRPSASFRSFSVTDLIEPRSVIPSLFGGLVFFPMAVCSPLSRFMPEALDWLL
ncbi:MAG: MFS transporter [Acidaminococcus intestini]